MAFGGAKKPNRGRILIELGVCCCYKQRNSHGSVVIYSRLSISINENEDAL